MGKQALRVVAAFAAIYLVWGSTYLAIRYAIETVPPFLMMAMRSVVAGSILYVWGRWRGGVGPRPVEWAGGLLVGAALFLAGHGGLAWAQQRVPSGVASLFMATLPLWMTLADRVAEREARIGGRRLAGIGLGIAGILLLAGPGRVLSGAPVEPVGAAVLLAAAISWTAGSALAKRLPRPASLAVTTGMYLLGGGILLAGVALLAGEVRQFDVGAVSVRSGMALGYLVVFGSLVGFGAYSWLLRHVSLGAVSTYALVNPVIAVFLGWWLGGEAIGARLLLAAAAVVAAVGLILTGQRGAGRASRPLRGGRPRSLPTVWSRNQPGKRRRMIARIWRGRTRAAQADAYVEYVRSTGVVQQRATPGNRASMILRRDHGDEAEFLVISFWDGLDAVRNFAGERHETAVYFPEDERYLLEMEPAVVHYEVVARESD